MSSGRGLGFEARNPAFRSRWAPIAIALQTQSLNTLTPSSRLRSHCTGIGLAFPMLHPICTQKTGAKTLGIERVAISVCAALES